MNTLILILLVLLWSTVAFTGGFLFCLIKFNGKGLKLDTSQFSKSRDAPNKTSNKELTPEQELKIKKLKMELQNFANYDGTEQEEVIV